MAFTTNGSSSSATDGMSAAERLMHAHKVTVEDAADEDLPSAPADASAATAGAGTDSELNDNGSIGSKAAGKKPARDAPAAKANKSALDTQSEELFPSLGAPKAPSAGSSMWSKKPAAVGNANGTANVRSVNVPAGAGKQASGLPNPSAGIQRGPAQVSLPGRNSEQVVIPASFMTPRAQLKRPVADILRDINKRSKANVEMKSGPGGSYIFEGTGPTDAVRIALKEVASQLCSKQTARVPVPMSVRGRIVGKQGATIQAISKKTGARINISKQEAAEILEDDDMDATIDVTIEGDPFAVQMARGDIERIVNEHTSSGTSRLKNIPAEYYPFLAAPHNQRLHGLQQGRDLKINIPQYHTWNIQSPPTVPDARQPAAFKPQSALPISLAGDRQAVAEARAEIERQVQELQQLLTLEQVSVEKGRHQFIVGEKGKALHDFLHETGCSVILPPDGDESEMLAVVGPADKIEEATNKVMELASSMAMASADIARAHASAPKGAQVHARDITRYLQQRSALQDLERTHNARIVPDSAGAWQIYARDGKNAIKARADIMNLIAGHPPSRFQSVQVDPFYHQHIRENAASQIRDKHGVRVILPDEFSDEPVLLVFEDRAPSPEYSLPRGVPQAQQVQTFEQALQQAQQEIDALLSGRPEIVSRQVDAPPKFHEKIRRHVDNHHRRLEEGQLPVQVSYGGQRQSAPRRTPAGNLDLRGPQDSVDALLASLVSFIEQEHRDELERDFKLSFEFPQKHANHLIGRKGEHINSLREQFDVDIQLNDGLCEVKGPEAKANLCKQHILRLVKKLDDEKVHHLNIPPEFHKDLIGAQGSQVNRLQDRYGVRVQFPRNKQSNEDESAAVEGAPRRDAQKPNEVIVKGPSKGADGCREELLSLLEYVKDNSHSATVSVAQSQLPSLIGAGGKEMDALRLESGAQIDVPSSRDAAGPEGRVEIKIRGSKKAVDEAKKLVQEKAKVFDNTVTRTLDVERRHHRHIIGPGGSNLRSIILQAGGPEDTRLHNRMIRFPKTDAEGNDIRIEGQKAVVDKISAAIEAVVAEHESQVTEILEVKPDKHRLLIGRGGETRRQLEQQFGASINIPRQSETGPQRSQVRITGQPAEVDKAKAHILEITKDQEGETIAVPRKFHHIIADNGQFFRRLRNDHKVTVDHDGQRPPPKQAAPVPSRANGGGAMPLITDEPSGNANSHSWETHSLHGSTEDGEIPWVLSGPSAEAVQAARAKLNAAIADAGKLDTIGFLILPDPRAYRHVIGPGGSEINRIRKASGTKIQVPRDQNQGEAIEIQGSKEGVQLAKDSILEVVQNNS
ncbi:Putative K domain-containing protein [Septoria linicola]|uniref:K domain-containing protein n=1 Tax=Septoria linicola TaxID=215465 RepID=A0A9Q9EER9_9PEZI|nr:Putative K domain-containing protein [Septoria linicola]